MSCVTNVIGGVISALLLVIYLDADSKDRGWTRKSRAILNHDRIISSARSGWVALAFGIGTLAFAFGSFSLSLFLREMGNWQNVAGLVLGKFFIVSGGLFLLSLGVFKLRTRMYFNSVGLNRARFLGGEFLKVAYADIVEVKLPPYLSTEDIEAIQKRDWNLRIFLILRSGETYNLNPGRFGSRKAVLRKILDCVSESTRIDPFIIKYISEQGRGADVKDSGQ